MRPSAAGVEHPAMDSNASNRSNGARAVQRWVAVMNTGDAGAAAEIVDDEFVEHANAPFSTDEPGLVNGPAHLREATTWLRNQFPDLTMSIEQIAFGDDLVVVLISSTGTNLGALNGRLPATGRRFAARQTHWFKVRDGRLTEHWATRDDLSAMVQLGVVGLPQRV